MVACVVSKDKHSFRIFLRLEPEDLVYVFSFSRLLFVFGG